MSVLMKTMAAMQQQNQRPAPAAPAATDASPQLAEENERLRRKVAELSADKAKLEKDNATLTQRYESTVTERDRERVRSTLLQHANTLGAIDPEMLADYLGPKVKLADGKVVSIDDPTKGVEDVLKGYLEPRSYLVKPKGATGSGSSPFPASAPAPPAPEKHDMRTREGATAALHEQLRTKLTNAAAPAAPTGAGRTGGN